MNILTDERSGGALHHRLGGPRRDPASVRLGSAPNYPGDTMVMTGTVTAKTRRRDREVEVAATASATT